MLIDELVPWLPKPQRRMIAIPWVVGQFVMTWAKHERALANMLARIRQVDYEKFRDKLLDSQISAYEIEIKRTVNDVAIGHVARSYLETVLTEHVALRDLRHDVVHGFWAGIGPDDEYILKRKYRKGDDVARTLELEEIWEGYQQLDRLGVVIINAYLAFEGKETI